MCAHRGRNSRVYAGSPARNRWSHEPEHEGAGPIHPTDPLHQSIYRRRLKECAIEIEIEANLNDLSGDEQPWQLTTQYFCFDSISVSLVETTVEQTYIRVLRL